MNPAIPPGSLVIDRPVDPRTIHKGDVITFAVPADSGGTGLITHRVVSVSLTPDAQGNYQPSFTTKGDANNAADIHPVLAKNVRGRVWFHVPYIGEIRDSLHTGAGVSQLAILLLAGYALYQGVVAIRERRKPLRADAADAADAAKIAIGDLDRAQPQFALLMHLRRSAFDGLAPEMVARALGTSLVESDADTITLLAAHADRARDALELIDALDVRPTDVDDERLDLTGVADKLELTFDPEWDPRVADHLGVLVRV